MSMREKDQSDFDLDTFVDLFDTAMTSKNPAVQKAFKNLLMISAIINSERENNGAGLSRGPLRRLVDDIQNLNRRLSQIENQRIYPQGPVISPLGPNNIPVSPVITTPNTGSPWPTMPTTWCDATSNDSKIIG